MKKRNLVLSGTLMMQSRMAKLKRDLEKPGLSFFARERLEEQILNIQDQLRTHIK